MPAPRGRLPKLPPAELRCATATAVGEYWLDCAFDGGAAGRGAAGEYWLDRAFGTGAVGAGRAPVRWLADGRGVGVTARTVAGAAGALAATGAVVARLTWLP
jgi:hypothetical protein